MKKSWQPHQRLLLFLLLALALACTISPILTLGAGWASGLKILRVFGDYEREHLGWLFGSSDPKIGGVVTWAAIILVGAAVYHLTKNRVVRSSDLPHAVMA